MLYKLVGAIGVYPPTPRCHSEVSFALPVALAYQHYSYHWDESMQKLLVVKN